MVPPYSHRVSRVRRYSGYRWLFRLFVYRTLTFFGWTSHSIPLNLYNTVFCPNPESITTLGLASSAFARHYFGISVDFSSSPYLDVSVQAVPLIYLCIQYMMTRLSSCRIAPFGNLRIKAHLRLPAAYRS